ncbi:MAG: DUF6163 family protein [Devosia sp.]
MSGEETDPPQKAGAPKAPDEAVGNGKDGAGPSPQAKRAGEGKRTPPAAAALRQSLRKAQALDGTPPDGSPPRKSRPTAKASPPAKARPPAQGPPSAEGRAERPQAPHAKTPAKTASVPAKVPPKSQGAARAKLPAHARPAPVRDTAKAVAVRPAPEVAADPQLTAVSAAAATRKATQARLHSMTSQEDPLASKRNTDPDPLGFAIKVILRLAAVAWLAGAVLLWGRLVGYIETDLSPAWHDPTGPWVTTGAAAVAWPAVAVGLWLTSRWGVVLWGAALALEAAMILTDASLAPFGLAAFFVNVAVFAVVAALGGVRAVRRKEYI